MPASHFERFVPWIMCMAPMAALVTALEASPGGGPVIDRAAGTPLQISDKSEATIPPVPRVETEAERKPVTVEQPEVGSVPTISQEDVARARAQRCSDRRIRMDEAARTEIYHCAHPVRLALDDLVITVAGRPDPTDEDRLLPEVTIRRGRGAPLVVRPTQSVWGHAITVGRLDSGGARYVMIQGFTGGMHCCVSVEIALPDGQFRELIGIGEFEVGYEIPMDDPAPSDVDGDGHADFVGRDNRFFYEFTSYSGTHRPPPRIWNIRDGRAVEVSDAPRYRELFAESAAGARSACLEPTEDGGDRSACATYVASAARLGNFRNAWREVERSLGPKRGDIWGNPYLDHLRRFLRVSGYLGPVDAAERDDFAHTIHFPGESE